MIKCPNKRKAVMSKIKKVTNKCVRQRIKYLSEGPATLEWFEVGLNPSVLVVKSLQVIIRKFGLSVCNQITMEGKGLRFGYSLFSQARSSPLDSLEFAWTEIPKSSVFPGSL